jgi:hypothetical protein
MDGFFFQHTLTRLNCPTGLRGAWATKPEKDVRIKLRDRPPVFAPASLLGFCVWLSIDEQTRFNLGRMTLLPANSV